jgi:phosphoribosylformylglycinamidine synthase II
MLIVGKKGMEKTLYAVFDKWDLECAQIGEATDTGRLEFYHRGEKVADVPAEALVLGGGAPVYHREYHRPAYLKQVAQFKASQIPWPKDYVETAKTVCRSPNIASKRWIYEQYDSMVRTNTMTTNAPSDAAVARIKGSRKALAMTVDCNAAYVHADPYAGAMIAVAEAARNIVCSGGEPLAITNCLNFGNPYNPEVYWQFVHAIKGMGEACRKFGTPVTGGNVSFYNQSVYKDRTEPVYPTPTIGMLGILEDINDHMTLHFKAPGHQIYMIGTPSNDLNCSEYLRRVHQVRLSPAPRFDLEEEYQVQQNLKALIRSRQIESAHDISEGGLFVALLESALAGGLGFQVETDGNFRKDAYLFGESQSRVVITVLADNEDELVNYLNSHNVSFTKLGEVAGDRLLIDNEDFGGLEEWRTLYESSLSEMLES